MRNYYCMNPIAQVGLDNFSKNYIKTDEIAEAEGILVRSASMHDMELPDGLLAVARAVSTISRWRNARKKVSSCSIHRVQTQTA